MKRKSTKSRRRNRRIMHAWYYAVRIVGLGGYAYIPSLPGTDGRPSSAIFYSKPRAETVRAELAEKYSGDKTISVVVNRVKIVGG